MTLYLIRAGKYGDRERVALKNNVVTIGWNKFSDLSGIKKMRVVNEIGQLWIFLNEIKKIASLNIHVSSGLF